MSAGLGVFGLLDLAGSASDAAGAVGGAVTGVAGSVVGSVAGSVAQATLGPVLSGMSVWVAEGAAWVLVQLADLMDHVTAPTLGATWFAEHYRAMAGLALLLVLPLLLAAAIGAIVRQDAASLVRALVVQLPMALLGTAMAVELVATGLVVTDEMAATVSTTTGPDLGTFLTALAHRLDAVTLPSPQSSFAIGVVSLVITFAALALCLELVVRNAAVYVAVLFLPIALAGLVWPATARWARRLVETIVVLLLSKFVIVAVISLAASAAAAGAQQGDFSALLTGTSLLLLAAFCPFALLRLVPIVEAGMIGHLEGVGRRAVSSRPARALPGMVDGLLRGTGSGHLEPPGLVDTADGEPGGWELLAGLSGLAVDGDRGTDRGSDRASDAGRDGPSTSAGHD